MIIIIVIIIAPRRGLRSQRVNLRQQRMRVGQPGAAVVR
jgi:hypothetical protein